MIEFSPPDITDKEIQAVTGALKSGWITTGERTKTFEKELSTYYNTNKSVCLNSATAALELALYVLGIGEGDEVITSAYTYTSSASVIVHTGAKSVLVDTEKDSYFMDLEALSRAINKKTKVIIPVDIAGIPANFNEIMKVIESKKGLFKAENKIQEKIGRVMILSDSAHSIGSTYKNQKTGTLADFTAFSFHAVKNLTTAEGGSLTWNKNLSEFDEYIYKELQLLSLHGQNKDSLSKMKKGVWEYDIIYPGYKCNMTDLMASIGLVQLDRYESLLKRRREIVDLYNSIFNNTKVEPIRHVSDNYTSSYHLYLTRIKGISEEERNEIIIKMAKRNISTNVHYKPLPMFSAYKNLGFNINDYPNAYNQYINEITLPLHTKLTNKDVELVAKTLLEIVNEGK